jgi:hypothetical protein
MRALIKSVLIILIISTSCEKLETKHDLVGEWKFFGSGGGITGQGTTPGYNLLELNNKDEYQNIRHDTIVENGTYRISKNDLDFLYSVCSFKIKFTQKAKEGYSANQLGSYTYLIQMISQDTLALYEPYLDGFDYYFARQ